MLDEFSNDIHNYVQSKLRDISTEGPPVAEEKVHMSSAAKSRLAKGAVPLPAGASKRRKKYLHYAGNALMLLALFMSARQVFDFDRQTCLHVSFDANNCGGNECELGVIFSVAANMAMWLPPMVSTLMFRQALCSERVYAVFVERI